VAERACEFVVLGHQPAPTIAKLFCFRRVAAFLIGLRQETQCEIVQSVKEQNALTVHFALSRDQPESAGPQVPPLNLSG
jgi:hypothetical protein